MSNYDEIEKPKPMQAAEIAMMDGDITLCDFIQAIEMIRDQKPDEEIFKFILDKKKK
jgi:hypothetical protein